MRTSATIVLCAALVCCSLPAHAAGEIALYASSDGSDCAVLDDQPGVVQIHMFYEGDQTANSVAFAAPTPDCWLGAVWVGDIVAEPWLSGLGDTHDRAKGILINLLGCRSGPIYLGLMSFMTQGQGLTCCRYEVIGSEIDGFPAVVDCTPALVAVDTGAAFINPDDGCSCGEVDDTPLATETTTWGRVKSLYL